VKVTGIREKDGATVVDVGTGTIVHSVDGHAIVLTCAHLFLGISKKGPKIVVEVFENGTATAYPGEILGGTHESDLAFIKFQTAKVHTAVPLTSVSPKTDVGDALMSFGCNDGADPTPLETKLVDINFYTGPDNLICEHDPAGGRSGGGLFNKNGELVAICSCADRERKRGLYMAHSSILKLANKLELTSILKGSSQAGGLAIGEDASATFEEMRNPGTDATPKKELAKAEETSDGTFDAIFGGTPLASNGAESKLASNETQPTKSLTESNSGNPPANSNEQLEPEVVIEIVDRANGGKKRRVVIPKASPWLLEVLTGEGPDDPTAVAARYQKELEATRNSTNELTRTSQSSVSRNTAARRSTTQAP
jgi:hypothetical protein